MSNDNANLLTRRPDQDGRRAPEDLFASLLAGGQIAPLAEPQHHVEESVIISAIRDGKMLASDGADADTTEREDAGFDRHAAHHFDHRADVDARLQIG